MSKNEKKKDIFQPKVWIVTDVLRTSPLIKKVEEPWMFRKETEQPCKQEAESFDEALWLMTPVRAALICSKACDIIAEDAFCVASQHSIGLIDIKWGTFMRPRNRYVR